MKRIWKACLASMLAISMVGCTSNEDDGKTKVGIIQYAEHPALDQSRKGFIDALNEAGFTEENTIFDYKNASNDVSNCDSIADKLVNDKNDLIYAIATPAAQSVANKTKDIPIVLSAVTDPQDSQLVNSNEEPGNNVTGASDLTPMKEQLSLINNLVPDAKKIAILYCSSEDNSIFQADLAKKYAKELGLETIDATVSDSNMIQQVTESLIGKVDAIYVPTDNLLAEGMSTVTQVANENDLPCIVGESSMVKNGGLGTYGIDYYKLGQLAGKQAVQILKGEADPSSMPIEYLPSEECALTLNKTAADQLGITLPKELVEKAEVIE